MIGSAGKNLLALLLHHRIERPPCLENPRPAGAESTLTENVTSPFQAEPTHNDSYNYLPEMRKPEHILQGDRFAVEVKLAGIYVNETFRFIILADEGNGAQIF